MAGEQQQAAEVAAYAFGGTGLVTFLVMALRKIVRNISSEKLAVETDAAQSGVIQSLREEIQRLEVLVDKMQAKLETLDVRLTRFKTQVLDVQTDLLEIEGFLMRCTCEDAAAIRERLVSARRRLLEVE